jgi:hypothetical protein
MLTFILNLTKNILSGTETLSQKDKDLVVDNIAYAILQTKAHINSTRQRNKDKSSSVLANIWQRTASNIKGIENADIKELVEVIEQKSKYWSDPDSYDKKLFDQYQMKITQVESQIEKLCN